jgi:Ice-binding-like
MKFLERAALCLVFALMSACDSGRQIEVKGDAGDAGKADMAETDAPASPLDTRDRDAASSADVSRADVGTGDARDVGAASTDVRDGRDTASLDVPRADTGTGDARDAGAASADLANDTGNNLDVPRADAGNPDAQDGACAQAPVVLGAAVDFVVLAGSTVTNTGLSIVNGDLGVSPGSAVTGFGPGVLIGTQHAADTAAALAEAALTIAYNDAAGRVLCPIGVSGNLGGQTLTPGLYKSTGSLEISSGDLVLDARGNPNAVFIFQMASTFVTTSGRQVILSGMAKAANIFWQVGTSATLGSTSVIHGTILADQSIMLMTGASLNGRALARIAAVTLDTNAIVRPAP